MCRFDDRIEPRRLIGDINLSAFQRNKLFNRPDKINPHKMIIEDEIHDDQANDRFQSPGEISKRKRNNHEHRDDLKRLRPKTAVNNRARQEFMQVEDEKNKNNQKDLAKLFFEEDSLTFFMKTRRKSTDAKCQNHGYSHQVPACHLGSRVTPKLLKGF